MIEIYSPSFIQQDFSEKNNIRRAVIGIQPFGDFLDLNPPAGGRLLLGEEHVQDRTFSATEKAGLLRVSFSQERMQHLDEEATIVYATIF